MSKNENYNEVNCNDIQLVSFIVSHMHIDKKKIIEGSLRCEELKQHLTQSGSKMAVFLSEDASGVVKRVVYDPKTNELVGIVLPLKRDGMPRTFSFTPDSAQEIEELLKLDQSNLVYIVIAHPLASNAPAFILQIFGTNNKFSKDDVLQRWTTTVKELDR